ncbi:hypothetical protein ACP70R_027497 [Stipagrostis hirtigluma subsp. patula]
MLKRCAGSKMLSPFHLLRHAGLGGRRGPCVRAPAPPPRRPPPSSRSSPPPRTPLSYPTRSYSTHADQGRHSCPGDPLPLARLLFDTMPTKDAASYNTLLTALASRGKVAKELELLDEMPEPNVRSWAALIAGFAP